jgi:NTP pyrophosphatase (non-canonical NTP hydrolase)/deoxyadenosine/deoxycytidine kinase
MSLKDLRELQGLQKSFDDSRGLDDLPNGRPRGAERASPVDQEEADDRRLRLLEFCSLALCGETGEAANDIKKARRAYWYGQEFDTHLQRSCEELADVTAYLLKLANALDVDLTELYLEKMTENCVLLPSRESTPTGPRLICVAGPTGSGKTSVASRFEGRCQTYIESTNGNPYVRAVIANESGADFAANQHWFLDRIADFLRRSSGAAPAILDQDPGVVVRVYGKLFRSSGRLSRDSYTALLEELLAIESSILRWSGGRVLVLLDAPASVLRSRVAARDGVAPPLEWFERLREFFAEFRRRLKGPAVLCTADASIDEVESHIQSLL